MVWRGLTKMEDRSTDDVLARLVLDAGRVTSAQLQAARRVAAGRQPAISLALALAESRLLSHLQISQLMTAHAKEFLRADPRHSDRAAAWRHASEALARGVAPAGEVNSLLAAAEADPAAGSQTLHDLFAGPGAVPSPAADATRTGEVPTLIDRGTATEPATAPSPARVGPGRVFGPYQLRDVLGRGGMGVVYRAFHPGLQVERAVKVLHAGGAAGVVDLLRFRREAQAAARLHHPGIVRMHDIGEAEGTSYIAMELVEGESLDRVSREHPGGLAAPEAVRLIADAAEAIQHAHDHGVVHRDLKPANVIRTRDGRATVMDFGLAKTIDAGNRGLTATGAILGTPVYMSPEQANGRIDLVDALSDVYQLGALLHHLLTGRAPYEGDSPMGVVLQVAREAPPPPSRHRPGVDRDAETICLRAMAREREDRYATAAALADDCRRMLRGEPILARRAGTVERAIRWMRRHKAAGALAGVALAALVFACSVLRSSAGLEQQVVADLRALARANLEGALVVRRSGAALADAEAEFLAPLEEAVRKAEARAPGLAEPRFHLGRLYRALLRFREAEAEQEKALARDPDFARSRYERAILRSGFFAERLKQLREERRLAMAGPPIPDAELAAADAPARTLRESIVADLEGLRRLADRPGADPLPPAHLHCAQGLFLLHAGRETDRAETERLLREALRLDPGLEEASGGLAQSLNDRGDYAMAVETCTQGLMTDRGYLPFLGRRGDTFLEWGRQAEVRGEDPRPVYLKALVDYEELLAREPGNYENHFRRGSARVTLGATRSLRGEDPTEDFRSGEADVSRAIELNGGFARMWIFRAMLRLQTAVFGRLAGRDVERIVAGAKADADRAVALEHDSAEMLAHRAYLRFTIGEVATRRPEDEAALADWGAAIAADPSWPDPRFGRADALVVIGNREWAQGKDPTARYSAAAADFATAGGAGGSAVRRARLGLGNVNGLWGDWLRLRGEDPVPRFESALAGYREAAEADPADAAAWTGLGATRLRLAREEKQDVAAQRALYDHALADHAQAVKAAPGDGDARLTRVMTLSALANFLQAQGEDPMPVLELCLEDETVLVDRLPGLQCGWTARADTRKRVAVLLAARGEDVRARYREAIADCDRAAGMSRGDASLFLSRGMLRVLLGEAQASAGAEARAEFESAEVDFGRCTELAPEMVEGWWWRLGVRLTLAGLSTLAGGDPRASLEGAAGDAREVLKLRPGGEDGIDRGSQALWWLGAWLHSRGEDPRGRYDEGVALLETAEPPALRVRLGTILRQRAVWEMRTGGDAEPWLTRAEAGFRSAGETAAARLGLGDVRVNRAVVLELRGEDPQGELRAATEEYAAALTATPSAPEAASRAGAATAMAAITAEERGLDGSASCQAALAVLGKETAANPARADAWISRGALRAEWALRHVPAGEAGAAAWAESLADLDAGVARASIDASAWAWRGRARYYRAAAAQAAGLDPGDEWDAVRHDLDRALAIDPGFTMARVDRARLRARRGDADGALQDFAKALEVDPTLAEALWRRARLLERLGRGPEAEADRAKARGRNPRVDDFFGPTPE